MRKVLFLAVICLISSVLNAQSYRVVENGFSRVQIHFTAGELSSVDVSTDGGDYSRLVMPNATPSCNIGSPELPVMVEQMEIPLCDAVGYEIISARYSDFTAAELGINHPIYPAQPSAFKSAERPAFTKDAAAYQRNELLGNELITVEKKGVLRNINLATVAFSPIQYNPVANTYRIYSEVEVAFTFENADIPATYEMKSLHGNGLFNGLQSKVMNPIAEATREAVFSQPIKYLIVANSMFRGQMDDFVAWKKRCGFDVEIAYTDDAAVGTTTTSIAGFIKAKYTNATPANPAPTYVLLVGDIAQIPVFSGQSDSHKTDLYYFTWTDGDSYPDCFYGRFSVQTVEQLRTMVEKTLQYEQMTMPDPAYLDKAVLVAGSDANWSPTHANGQISYLYDNYINENEAGYATVYKHMYNSSSQAATIRQEIGAGVGYANYTAHCGETGWSDPAFETNHISVMSNANKYCFMVGNCCLSNKFDVNECFGEAITRTANKGAVSYIGGTNSTLWDEDFYWSVGVRSSITANNTYDAQHKGAYDRMFHTHGEAYSDWYITGGSMIMAGNLSVEASTSTYKLYYWEIYHILGDPSIMPWFTQPEEMPVAADESFVSGATTMTVTSVPYAYTALTENGEVIAAATADAQGVAQLAFNPVVPGNAYELAVSAQNYQTFFRTLEVVTPNGPYVVASYPTLSGSDEPNYGATVGIDATLRNLGVANASNITATLTTTSDAVTIHDNTESLASLNAGAEQVASGAFSFSIANDIADGTVVPFVITTQFNGNQTSTTNFQQVLRAPILSNLPMQTGELEGNSNNHLDAGELCYLRIPTHNAGHATAVGVFTTLSCAYEGATILNADASLGDIAAQSSATAEFSVRLSEDVPSPFIIPFVYNVWADHYSFTDTLYLFVGSAVEDFESNSFTSFNWQNGSKPWFITTSSPFEGSRCASPKSGMGYGESSTLTLSINATVNDSISFYRRLSSSAWYGSNELRFYIDGQVKESLSSNTSWSRASFPVSAGSHTIKFELYAGGYGGNYSAAIDFINFPMSGEMAPLAIEEMQPNTLSIWPNPTSDVANITIPANFTKRFKVALFDMSGKMLSAKEVTASESVYKLDVSNLSTGIYIISIFNDEGVFCGKVVRR